MASLDHELVTYERELPKLRPQTGRFALIKGEEVAGTFDTYNDALKIGYERFKLEPFLVKKIEVVEQVFHYTRQIVPLCP